MRAGRSVLTVDSADRNSQRETGLYVQFGCGQCAPPEWVNFDASSTLWFERIPLLGKLYTKNSVRFPSNVRYGNIVRGLPIPPSSCSGVYASHVLEHLVYDECLQAVDNTRQMLRPGGVFRLIVPDLEAAAQNYIHMLNSSGEIANAQFMEFIALGKRSRPKGLLQFAYSLLNTSTHLWMWDFPAMRAVLTRHGFSQIRRCRFNDSDDPMFRLVESEERFTDAVAIEAIR